MRAKMFVPLAVIAALVPPTWATAKAQPKISFVSPSGGQTVAGPVEVVMRVENFDLVDAGGAIADGEGHAHVLIDTRPPPPGEILTTDPTVVHLGKPPYDARAIPVGDGRHTLHAVLADSAHRVLKSAAADSITVNVRPGFRGRGKLEPACANVAKGSGEARIVFPLSGGAVQGTITSTCSLRTQDDACTWSDTNFRRIAGTYDARTKRVDAVAFGVSERRLTSGPATRCGSNHVTRMAPTPIAPAFDGKTLKGTVGNSSFVLRDEPALVLTAETRASQKAQSRIPLLPLLAAAVVAAGVAAYAGISRRRKSSP